MGKIKKSQLENFYHLKFRLFPFVETFLAILLVFFIILQSLGFQGISDYSELYSGILLALLYILIIHLILLLFTRRLSHVFFFKDKIKIDRLLQDLNAETFYTIDKVPEKIYLESEHWIYFKKKFIAKNSVIGFYQREVIAKGKSDHFCFTFLDGKMYSIVLTYSKDYTIPIEKHLKNTLPVWSLMNFNTRDGITRVNKNVRNIVKEYCKTHDISEIYNKNELLRKIIASQIGSG